MTKNNFLTLLFLIVGFLTNAQVTNAPCNDFSTWTSNNYSSMTVANQTGLFGDSWSNKNNLIDKNTGNAASWSAILLGSSWIEARNASGSTFPAGSYAGFVVGDLDLVSLGASMKVATYNGTTKQEEVNFSSLVGTILDGGGKRKVGFFTTKPFNRLRLTVNAGLTLVFTANAYYAEVVKPCAGAALACNTTTDITRTNYGAIVEPSRTGMSGLFLGSVSNADNVANANVSDFATITINTGVAASGSISIRNIGDTFPAGTYAGFDVENQSLINAQFFNNITLKSYKNGVLQETVSGSNLLMGLGSDAIASTGRSVVGFLTTKAFDELQITVNSLATINIGNTKVYKMIAMKPCQKTISCNSSYYLTQPDFPVVLNSQRTGLGTLACIGCSVNSADHVIDNDPNNYSRITLAAGVGNTGSISVMDPTATYPKGTYTGFTVKDRYFVYQGDFLEYITIKTYLNGVLQESKTSNELFDLSFFIPIWGTGTKNVGFYTTKDFNEVQIETGSIGSVVNVLDVYSAFIDTRSSNGGSLNCVQAIAAADDSYTINVGGTSTASVITNDTYQGNSATLGASGSVVLTQNSGQNNGITIDPNTGLVKVSPNTAAGTYPVTYTICNKVTPASCDFATVNVVVAANSVNAQDDILTIDAGTTSSVNVLLNDTVNGLQAVLGNLLLTQVSTSNSGVTLNALTGNVSVASGTAPGTYQIVYKATTLLGGNSDTATVTVIVPGIPPAPDMKIEISASSPQYSAGSSLDTFYTVSNVGNAPTNGSPVKLSVTIVAEQGDYAYTLPSGWNLQSHVGNNFVFTTNKIFNQGDSDTLIINYTSTGNSQVGTPALFNALILLASGGDINVLNNTASEVIIKVAE
ncbi:MULTISPECIES: hypothetical protein [Chryseobacterium]|uniref:Uncharacterized protein n=1 Tax=Chryseobacterium taihuense TaxID=1141221 RepID=A0A4U8WDN0_9FLAO|nr:MULTISPECIES: hypothetical protein [Chryseobacterium]QQV02256.1 hypothetical protein I6I61_14470 [Chryseobacterium sp. FDAARGOS 1104]VFB04501.1 Uncharacterised protein [Chryseobacterium taihuense]